MDVRFTMREAIAYGRFELVTRLWEQCRNQLDEQSIMRLAIEGNRCGVIDMLIESGVNFNQNGFEALVHATSRRNSRIDMVRCLLKHGANVNVFTETNAYGFPMRVPPLWLAVRNGNFDIAEELIKHGATIKIDDDIWLQARKKQPTDTALLRRHLHQCFPFDYCELRLFVQTEMKKERNRSLMLFGFFGKRERRKRREEEIVKKILEISKREIEGRAEREELKEGPKGHRGELKRERLEKDYRKIGSEEPKVRGDVGLLSSPLYTKLFVTLPCYCCRSARMNMM